MTERPYVVIVTRHKGNDRAVAFATKQEAKAYCEVQKLNPNTKGVGITASQKEVREAPRP